ncbi:MAG: murein biosynthesis integral membrane protein MurJ [Nocardioidaceae bacterium]|nr:murein biosynthesis integral membrane protein MurJ [Nocardioidaceae bacterium]
MPSPPEAVHRELSQPADAPNPPAQASNLLSSSLVMAVGTSLSRLTGFFRAGLLAAAIGVAEHADVSQLANTIPNRLYILVAGGVFNTVLVPQLVRAVKSDPDGGDAYASRIVTLGALVLGGVTAVLVLLAPQLMRLMVDDAIWADPATRESLVDFARWCLPQIFFYGTFVLIGQILNARGRFGPMMWAPIANNVVSIAIIVTYLFMYADESATGGYTATQELLLGLGSTVGIAVQLAILVPYLRASGFSYRPRFDFRGTGLGHTLRLGSWTVGMVVVNQLAFYVMVHLASAGAAADSGFTVYANAFLLTQVPHSIVTVSLATAAVPLMSRLAADSLYRDVAAEMTQTMRLALAVIVPFAALLCVLSGPTAVLLFGYGAAQGDTGPLGQTMIAFAPGMIMFSIHYLALRGFYALEDTRTTFFIQCLISVVNMGSVIALTSLITAPYTAPALAAAYGTSYLVGGVVSSSVLARRLGGLAQRELATYVARLALAAGLATAIAWLCTRGLELLDIKGSSGDKADVLVVLAVSGLLGVGSYLLLARLLRISETASIVRLVAARSRRG